MRKRIWVVIAAALALNGQPGSRSTVLLKDWKPRSSLVVPVTTVERAKYPAIDFHAHSDLTAKTREGVDAWVKQIDAAGLETVVVNTDAIGAEFDRQAELFQSYGKRFQVYCIFDNSNPDAPDYPERVVRELERCYRKGARGVGEISDKGYGLEGGMAAVYAVKPDGTRDAPPDKQRLHLDDHRLDAFWEKCADLNMPVSLHIADHPSCWQPLGPNQERLPASDLYNMYGKDVPSFEELLRMRDRVLERHPRTKFVAAHLSNNGNDLAAVARALDRYPNLYLDISARAYELGRQPRNAVKFLTKYRDRIVFGTDDRLSPGMYQKWWHFLETTDEYLPGSTGWPLYALGLDDETLHAIYRGTAKRILNWQ